MQDKPYTVFAYNEYFYKQINKEFKRKKKGLHNTLRPFTEIISQEELVKLKEYYARDLELHKGASLPNQIAEINRLLNKARNLSNKPRKQTAIELAKLWEITDRQTKLSIALATIGMDIIPPEKYRIFKSDHLNTQDAIILFLDDIITNDKRQELPILKASLEEAAETYRGNYSGRKRNRPLYWLVHYLAPIWGRETGKSAAYTPEISSFEHFAYYVCARILEKTLTSEEERQISEVTREWKAHRKKPKNENKEKPYESIKLIIPDNDWQYIEAEFTSITWQEMDNRRDILEAIFWKLYFKAEWLDAGALYKIKPTILRDKFRYWAKGENSKLDKILTTLLSQ